MPHLSNKMRHASTGTRMHPWGIGVPEHRAHMQPYPAVNAHPQRHLGADEFAAGRHAGRRGGVRIHAQAACIKHAAIGPGAVVRILLNDGDLPRGVYWVDLPVHTGKFMAGWPLTRQHAALVLQMNHDFAVPRLRLPDALVMVPDVAREAVLGVRYKSVIKKSTCRPSSTACHAESWAWRNRQPAAGRHTGKGEGERGARHAACFHLFPRGNQARFPSVPACLEES